MRRCIAACIAVFVWWPGAYACVCVCMCVCVCHVVTGGILPRPTIEPGCGVNSSNSNVCPCQRAGNHGESLGRQAVGGTFVRHCLIRLGTTRCPKTTHFLIFHFLIFHFLYKVRSHTHVAAVPRSNGKGCSKKFKGITASACVRWCHCRPFCQGRPSL